MSNLPQAPPGNQFKPAPNPPGVTTPGIHTGEPYTPSSDMAWGPRGKWEGKAWTDVSFERQVSKTKCVVGYDGYIDDARTWESRGSDRESTFRPNVKNIAPRPANWKKDSAPPVSY